MSDDSSMSRRNSFPFQKATTLTAEKKAQKPVDDEPKMKSPTKKVRLYPLSLHPFSDIHTVIY